VKVVLQSNITQVSARYRNMARNLPGVVDRALQSLAHDEGVPLFQNTTKTWQHKPTFTVDKTERGWAINTTDQIYQWVDQGTKPHIIAAKNVLLLKFPGPYQPKTKPNVIGSFNGGVGKVWTSKRMVHHPGTEARNFRDIIMRRLQARAANQVRAALDEASWGMGTGL
jgi:hypothetical protein